MRRFQLRPDLERASLADFRLPLGLVPGGACDPPVQGYTVDYTPGEDEDPDSYAFYVTVSHELVQPIVRRAFELLPPQVYGIIEVGSRDAYRELDVFMGREALDVGTFIDSWAEFEPFLLEDGSIGAGANSEEPLVEVFLDQWKGISIHVPLLMRDDVEGLLGAFGLHEVPQTWPDPEDEDDDLLQARSVLHLEDEFSPCLDEMLLQLRQAWDLELNVDPTRNTDAEGRDLGATLWHAMVIVEPRRPGKNAGYASIWATATSLAEMETMIDHAIAESEEWRFEDIYTIDRVAFDERPEELADLPPRRTDRGVHLVVYDA